VVIVVGMVVLAFFASGLFLLVREGRFDPIGWGIMLSMGTYACFRSRAIPYFILTILPPLALALVRIADQRSPGGQERSRRWLERAGALVFLLVLAASIVDQALYRPRFPRGFGVRPNLFPEGASAFLERHRLDGRLFNAYQFGGYLIWRRWPANQVIIDGRYDAVLFDQALLEAYFRAYRSPDTLHRLTAAYRAEILVLSVSRNSLRMAYIDEDPRWVLVYWDNVAEVFVRRGGRHAGLAADHEYRLTRAEPDLSYLTAYRGDRETWSRAVGELKRAAADNPENTWAWLGLAQETRAAGPPAVRDRLEALTHLVALLPAQPATGGLHAERAEVLLQFGRSDEAAAAAREALRLDGSLLPARWVLAVAAERRGDWAEARDQYRGILARLDSGHAEAPAIRARLDAAERNLREASRR
jgi:tetratricopeptide (TPR) repeat protein